MNEYNNILTMQRCRTENFGMDIKYAQDEACPVCGGMSWDYLLKDKDGNFVGCDDCLRKIYS